jgi:GNAT superfamily N-acetyltransferase
MGSMIDIGAFRMDIDGIEYRNATRDDLDGIIEVWKESEEYHSELDPRLKMKPNAADHIKKFYSERFFNEDSAFFLAVKGERVVGYASVFLQKRPPIHFEEFWGFIEAIVISSKYRRQGIGTNLFNHVRRWLKDREIVTIRLTVATKNPHAVSFWRKMGFIEIMHIMDCRTNCNFR